MHVSCAVCTRSVWLECLALVFLELLAPLSSSHRPTLDAITSHSGQS